LPESLIALGANLSDKSRVLHEAVEYLANQPGVRFAAMSEVVETFPIGVPDSDATFLNAAARFEVDLEPRVWLETLLETERRLGRERTVRWGARKIDLDLLLFGEEVIYSQPLWVPHPRMAFRRFVMQPAVDVGGEMLHPLCGSKLSEIWGFLNRQPNLVVWLADQEEYRELVGPDSFHHTAVCRWLADENDFEALALEQRSHLAGAPIHGEDAVSCLWMVSPLLSVGRVRSWMESHSLRPKLLIRGARSHAWFEETRALLDEPPRIELQLDSDDPQRIHQEVVGAIESMLVL
jgi:2-amino-4-hydroxy-6-hydroxymethyldihydropteridine diphosphokinase